MGGSWHGKLTASSQAPLIFHCKPELICHSNWLILPFTLVFLPSFYALLTVNLGSRDHYIRQLLLPEKLTVLDESLALALWFAARGRGWLYGSKDFSSSYTSPAKVSALLLHKYTLSFSEVSFVLKRRSSMPMISSL